jgi:hypothetical protein
VKIILTNTEELMMITIISQIWTSLMKMKNSTRAIHMSTTTKMGITITTTTTIMNTNRQRERMNTNTPTHTIFTSVIFHLRLRLLIKMQLLERLRVLLKE